MLELRELDGEIRVMKKLQEVLEAAPTYFERVMGYSPGPSEALSTYTILPPGKTYADKSVFGVYLGENMIGCIDIFRGHPNSETAYLGLLLLREDQLPTRTRFSGLSGA